ncbi:MAG: N-acetylneuraminate synthase family protein [Planctomycetes bacterium]|nr:N-acetylneuraminate synthase family protein [Planctomycetota bacterium]
MRTRTIEIKGRWIGDGEPVWILAEIGVNHCGDGALALALVDAARRCGADGVKVQVFRADRLVAAGTPTSSYQGIAGEAREMLRSLELEDKDLRAVRIRAEKAGLAFVASFFDEDSLARTISLGPDALKIASGEIVSLRSVAPAARAGLPILASTGMATLEEIDRAREHFAGAAVQHALLHCVSAYPTPPAEANLRAIAALRERYPVPIGYSDHTEGVEAAPIAVALGASIIEKHITLDRSLPGPDHRTSLDPDGFRALVERIREAESMLGNGEKSPRAVEEEALRLARKSLHAARAIPPGKAIAREDLDLLRPAVGIPPFCEEQILGRRAAHAIPAGAPLRWEDLE